MSRDLVIRMIYQELPLKVLSSQIYLTTPFPPPPKPPPPSHPSPSPSNVSSKHLPVTGIGAGKSEENKV